MTDFKAKMHEDFNRAEEIISSLDDKPHQTGTVEFNTVLIQHNAALLGGLKNGVLYLTDKLEALERKF